MPNISRLLGLEPFEKFSVGGGGWVGNTVNIVFCFGPRLGLKTVHVGSVFNIRLSHGEILSCYVPEKCLLIPDKFKVFNKTIISYPSLIFNIPRNGATSSTLIRGSHWTFQDCPGPSSSGACWATLPLARTTGRWSSWSAWACSTTRPRPEGALLSSQLRILIWQGLIGTTFVTVLDRISSSRLMDLKTRILFTSGFLG